METVLITGGTGLIGKALGQALLDKGYKVIILSRQSIDSASSFSYASWNVEQQTIEKSAIEMADYIVHLAGAGVAERRWTKKRKQEIVNSRVNSSRLIAESLRTIPNKVKAVVSASAIGWYGPDPAIPNSKPFAETDPCHNDFLGMACKQWEESIEPVTQLGKRLVKFRTGIVLSRYGGALKEFKRPLRFGIAAVLGKGRQVISWIHIDDLVQLYIRAIENTEINGVYNAVAPASVSNKELTLQLAKSRKRFFVPIHIPSFLLKLFLGEMSIEVLKSCTVSSKKIEETGYQFLFPSVQSALQNLK